MNVIRIDENKNYTRPKMPCIIILDIPFIIGYGTVAYNFNGQLLNTGIDMEPQGLVCITMNYGIEYHKHNGRIIV